MKKDPFFNIFERVPINKLKLYFGFQPIQDK